MSSWAGRRVVVVGAGRSGTAAAELLLWLGATVTVTDRRGRDECGDLAPLEDAGATFALGGHPDELWDDADLVVASPGIAPSAPPLLAARQHGIEVISEIELAARFAPAPALAITGSNGKSTVTAMVGAILEHAGLRAPVCGNIGVSWAGLVAAALRDNTSPDLYVLELSSFQTEAVVDFHPRWCAVLNISPDHLDRHGDFSSYAAAKMRIAHNCVAADWFVYGADDEHVASNLPAGPRAVPFATAPLPAAPAAFLRDEHVIWCDADGQEHRVVAIHDLQVLGAHNALNACAATALAMLAGASPEAAGAALQEFTGLPHRTEVCGVIDGVRCVNDSKATNVGATTAALSGIDAPIRLILGGRDKDSDFASLIPHLGGVRGVLLIGEASEAIAAALGDAVPLRRCGTLDAAVDAGLQEAEPGEVLLLAPACTSFDQYTSFEARGEHFRELIAARV
jgi:UDP-N-acetylmuramoylalanine--D-glutamate ligase